MLKQLVAWKNIREHLNSKVCGCCKFSWVHFCLTTSVLSKPCALCLRHLQFEIVVKKPLFLDKNSKKVMLKSLQQYYRKKSFPQKWHQQHQHRKARRHSKGSSAVSVTEVKDTWKGSRKGSNVQNNMSKPSPSNKVICKKMDQKHLNVLQHLNFQNDY